MRKLFNDDVDVSYNELLRVLSTFEFDCMIELYDDQYAFVVYDRDDNERMFQSTSIDALIEYVQSL